MDEMKPVKPNEKNPFKQIEGDKPVPQELKGQVMTSVRFAEFLVGVGELFSVNFFRTMSGLAGDKKTNKKYPEESEPDKQESGL